MGGLGDAGKILYILFLNHMLDTCVYIVMHILLVCGLVYGRCD